MTIKESSLGDRLNDFKNKKSSDEKIENIFTPTTPLKELFDLIITFTSIFIKSFVLGYSAKLIFNTDWKFFGFFCVGLSITLIMQFIDNLFHPDNS